MNGLETGGCLSHTARFPVRYDTCLGEGYKRRRKKEISIVRHHTRDKACSRRKGEKKKRTKKRGVIVGVQATITVKTGRSGEKRGGSTHSRNSMMTTGILVLHTIC